MASTPRVFDLDIAGVCHAYRMRDNARFVELGKQLAIELDLPSLDGYLERFAERDRATLVRIIVTRLYEAITGPYGYGFEHVARAGIRVYTCLVVRGEDRVVVGVQPSFAKTPFPNPGWRFPKWHVDLERNVPAVAMWTRDPARASDAVAFAIARPSAHVAPSSRLDDTRGRDLLAEVRANPADDGARLVYADWLLERGDVRGELIQIQCELARNQVRDPRRPALRERERELLNSIGAVLFGGVAGKCESFVVRRGLIDSITIRPGALAQYGDALLDEHPIRDVSVLVDARTFPRLRSLRVLQRIPCVRIAAGNRSGRSRRVDLPALMRTRIFANTEQLSLSCITAAEAEWDRLLAELVAPRLRSIHLDGIDLGAVALAHLARTTALPLEEFHLGSNGLVPSSAEPALHELAARPGLRSLSLSSLPFNGPTTDRVIAEMLSRASALTELAITNFEATDAMLAMLADWIVGHPLDHLHLRGHALTVAGYAALLRAPGLANVASLVIDPPWSDEADMDLLADALLQIASPIRVRWGWAKKLGPVRGPQVLERVDLVVERPDDSLDLVSFG